MKPSSIITLVAALLITAQVSAFDLKDLSGKSTSIKSLLPLKQWTLVMLWSIDCVACEEQKPMINAFHTDHHLSNARVIGIATDGDQRLGPVIDHINKRPTTFENYVTLHESFEQSFTQETGKRFFGTPTYLLYDPEGQLVGTHAGLIDRAMLERVVGEPTELQVVPAELMR